MANSDSPLVDPILPDSPLAQPDTHQSSAMRIAGIYLIAGVCWIGLSDLVLTSTGGLTATGVLVSVVKGAIFVALSTLLVFWLCQREYRNAARSNSLLRAVVEGTTDAVFVKDRDGRYMLVNSASAECMGRSVANLLGRDDSELLDGPDAERLMANDRDIMAGGKVVTLEETIRFPGGLQTFEATKAPYFDATGAVIGLIGVSRNITERKQFEAALRETDARLREAQRIARLGSWSWEPPTDRVWWSEAEFELFGVDPVAVQPSFKAFLELLHPEDRSIATARVEAMLAGANEFADDLRVVRGDGSYMWIHSQARATRGSTGALIRVEGTDQDITIQKLAEEEARESERRLQAAVEVAALGVIVIDYEQQTAEFSRRAAEQFGFSPNTRVSRQELRSRCHEGDQEQLAKAIEVALNPAGSGEAAFEHRIVRPDETIRWLNVRIQVSFVDGRPATAVVVTADVTERRNAEARLREQEMLVREAAELAKVGGWGFDPATLQPDWTPAVAEMYGLDPDSPPPVSLALNSYSGDQRAALEEALAAAISEGTPHDMELHLTAANGEQRWVRTICRPIVENGQVVRVRGSLQDITERKRAESELRASEERYRLLFDSNPHPMWVYDVESLKFLAVNDTAVLAYGYTRDEFLAMTIRDIRPADEVEELELLVGRAQRGLSRSQQFKHCRKDGTVFDVEVSSYDLPEDQGHSRLVLALDITDRKRAEAELFASERRLRLALEAAGAIAFVWEISTDSVTRYYSTESALPITVERVGNLDEVRAAVHPDDLQQFNARLSQSLAEGSDYKNEYRVVRCDDTIVCLEDYGYIDRAADGSPQFLTGMVLDVTERVKATEALRLSEARYRQLVDMLPTAIFVYADNAIMYGNPAFERLMGAEKSNDLMGRSPFEIFHATSHESLRRWQEEMAHTGTVLQGCEMLGLRCDGRSVPLHVVGSRVEGYGQPATLVALSDLTERERSAALLRSVVDSVGDAILTIDAQGVVTSASGAIEQLFGYIESDLLGQNMRVLMPETHLGQTDQFLTDQLQTNAPKVTGVGREVECRRIDGTAFPAELTITEFLRDGAREFTVVLRDITARRQLEEQFRQSQKMEAVGRLAGGVAHDFNNLLTVINGYAELVLASLASDDKARMPLAAIHDAGERASRLTNQLLALSRRSMVEPRLVDLNELVAESANLFRRLIGEDIALIVLSASAPVRVVLDPGQLEQVLMNLVVNARDAMPTGGRLTIETCEVEHNPTSDRSFPDLLPGRYASLRATDTGCGIRGDVKDKIFEPFFSTKGVGKGTGLGLAVVHGVVKQSGGAITVESTVDLGTSFKVLFPSASKLANEDAIEEKNASTFGGETVLIVEDEAAVRTLVRLVLEGHGYTVFTAAGGVEALECLRTSSSRVDLLVTDVIMPGMSGRELAEIARNERPGLRVLYMSGYTDDALDRHGLQGTTDQFIQKPFTPQGLAGQVRAILDQH